MYGSDLLKVLGAALSRTLDGKRPFFLFVNVADAHQPWSDVPKGHAWLKTPRKSVKYGKVKDDDVWRSYIEGRMGAKQQVRFLSRITDLYDQGVSNADRSLGAIVSRIEEVGICDSGCRWVVTSDHGEFLGEHRLLDHGHYLYEENARVPLVIWGDGLNFSEWPAAKTNGDDNPVVSAMQSFYLSRDGQAATLPLPVTSMAWPHARRCARTQGQAFCTTSAAIWNPNDSSEKLLWADGVSWRIDLDSDPTESNPIPLTDHPLASELQALAEKMAPTRTADETRDPAVTQMLQSLGYLD